jgi:predicted acyl esterase
VRIEGRWRFERGWPPEGVRARRLFAQRGGRLGDRPGAASEAKLLYRAAVGTTGRTWAPNGDGSYGVDQRADDAYCVTFNRRTTIIRGAGNLPIAAYFP